MPGNSRRHCPWWVRRCRCRWPGGSPGSAIATQRGVGETAGRAVLVPSANWIGGGTQRLISRTSANATITTPKTSSAPAADAHEVIRSSEASPRSCQPNPVGIGRCRVASMKAATPPTTSSAPSRPYLMATRARVRCPRCGTRRAPGSREPPPRASRSRGRKRVLQRRSEAGCAAHVGTSEYCNETVEIDARRQYASQSRLDFGGQGSARWKLVRPGTGFRTRHVEALRTLEAKRSGKPSSRR